MEWIGITISTGKVFSCPVNGWLDNDDFSQPSSRTVSCVSLGNFVTFVTIKHRDWIITKYELAGRA